jgi:hypothetical protein
MKDEQKSRRDHSDRLTSTTKDGKIELAEEQLSQVSGGYPVAKLVDKTTTIFFKS